MSNKRDEFQIQIELQSLLNKDFKINDQNVELNECIPKQDLAALQDIEKKYVTIQDLVRLNPNLC